jgi:YD repeat-containing protein
VGSANEQRTELFEYDANSRQTAQINGEGERTEFDLRRAGNRTTVTVAKGLRNNASTASATTATTAGRQDRRQRRRDPVRYDGAGNKVKTIQLAAATTAPAIPSDVLGQPIAGQQRETLFTYDLDNRLTSVTDPMGSLTSFVIDALGNRTRITDAKAPSPRTRSTPAGAGQELGEERRSRRRGRPTTLRRVRQRDASAPRVRRRHRHAPDHLHLRQARPADRLTEYDKVDNFGPATVFVQGSARPSNTTCSATRPNLAWRLLCSRRGLRDTTQPRRARVHAADRELRYDKLDRSDGVDRRRRQHIAYTYDAHGNRTARPPASAPRMRAPSRFGYDKADRTVRQDTGVGGVIKLSLRQGRQSGRRETLQSGTEAAGVWVTESFGYDGNGRIIRTDGLASSRRTFSMRSATPSRPARRPARADERVLRSEYNKNNDLTRPIDALGNRTDYRGRQARQPDQRDRRAEPRDPAVLQRPQPADRRARCRWLFHPLRPLTRPGNSPADTDLHAAIPGAGRWPGPAGYVGRPMHRARRPMNTMAPATSCGRSRRTSGSGNSFSTRRQACCEHRLRISNARRLSAPTTTAPRVQTFTYDAAGRLTRFTNVDGVIETYAYDTANNRISESITNPNAWRAARPIRCGRRCSSSTRSTGRRDRSSIPRAQPGADPGYDKAGNVVAKTDARGNRPRWPTTSATAWCRSPIRSTTSRVRL